MAGAEKRRNGIAFQLEDEFECEGFRIPQSELYQFAEDENCSYLLKESLALRLLRKRGLIQTVHVAIKKVGEQV